MRLKGLRIHGFKSFADRTEFSFPEGITCIVGPNGCGKSNVVEAVKWVLGEQRPSALRGSEMGDVIFGGTERRKPLGMSEVSLVFDNSDGILDLDFTEVEVARRLFRDGTSEYLLNRQKCRLRDLRELLMDTGSGPGALTFMEQGKIDQILRESTHDRRAVFEEAAGISRYKARRKETLRKLERVEADLLRVSDVVEEKQRLVRSLKVQAGRAERYRALLDELNAKRLALAVYRYGILLADREAATCRVADLSESEAQARALVSEALAACRNAESDLERSRGAAARTETEIATLEAQAENARERAAFAARMVAELDGKIRWYHGEVEDCGERITEIEAGRVEVDASRDEAERTREECEARLAACEVDVAQARERMERVREETQRVQREHYEQLANQSRLGNRRSHLEAESRGAESRGARLLDRSAVLEEEARTAASRLEAANEAFANAEAAGRDAGAELAAAEEALAAQEERVAVLRDVVAGLDREVSGARSRADVLEKLAARMEGVGQGARKLLDLARVPDSPVSGVRGLLADLVETDVEHATAVETALGSFATAVVVDTFADAERAIGYLAEHRLGRAVFLPLDTVRAAGRTQEHEGALRLLDVVRCPDEVRPAVEAVLGGAVSVEDLESARALHRRAAASGESPALAVTSSGALLTPAGALEGGGVAGGAGILTRNTELRDLQARLAEATVELDAARTAHGEAGEALSAARQRVAAARDEARRAEGAVHRGRGGVERIAAEADRNDRERRRVAGEIEEVDQERGRVAGAMAEVDEKLEAVAAVLAEVEARRADRMRVVTQAEDALRAKETDRGDARVALAAIAERCSALTSRAADLDREIGELREAVVEARREMELCEKRRVDSQERGRKAHEEQEKAQKRRDQCVREIAELRHQVSQAQQVLEERRTLHEGLDSEAAGVTRELHRFRLREQEMRVRVENLVERIQEELSIDLHAAWESRAAAAPPGAEPAQEPSPAAPSSPVYAEQDGEAAPLFDPDQTESEIAELKLKIARMGAVNLEALDQLSEADTEAQRLLAHHADLTKSREALMAAIKKIDAECRDRFTQTFEAVQKNFRQMFRKLFGGGKADIVLEEGQDVLEAGVEIMARPPGKELRSISLLSGGERTMTAVALMFAIYMARPSPFCLLDEVDAALDEGNIDRFVSAVQGFAEQSQFIIVTHNKRTMGMADTIFGVSMPERGVSRRIAVRLEDIGDDGQIRAA